MTRFQIRDADFGLALIDAETATDALAAFVADTAAGEIRPLIASDGDGTAEVDYRGVRYRAVPIDRKET